MSESEREDWLVRYGALYAVATGERLGLSYDQLADLRSGIGTEELGREILKAVRLVGPDYGPGGEPTAEAMVRLDGISPEVLAALLEVGPVIQPLHVDEAPRHKPRPPA